MNRYFHANAFENIDEENQHSHRYSDVEIDTELITHTALLRLCGSYSGVGDK